MVCLDLVASLYHWGHVLLFGMKSRKTEVQNPEIFMHDLICCRGVEAERSLCFVIFFFCVCDDLTLF